MHPGSPPASPERPSLGMSVACVAVLLGAVFLMDLRISLGIAVPMLYAVVVLAAVRCRRYVAPGLVGLLGTVLTLVAWQVKPAHPELMSLIVTNRVLSIVAIWLTTGMAMWLGRAIDAEQQQRAAAEELAETVRRDDMALAASQRRLQELNDAIDESAIVARTDASGKITYANDKFVEISGFSREELIGQDHRIINSGTHPKSFMRDLWRTIGKGEIWRGEIRNRSKDGRLYWVDTTIVPFLDPQGRPEQYISVRFDITDRKVAEARLREQSTLARLGEMATIVAHEVRNPLAGVGGALQILATRVPEGSEEREIIHYMNDRIRALNNTLSDVLAYARPRAPKQEPLDLRQLADDVAAGVRTDPRFQGIDVQVEGEPIEFQGDHDLLRAAVLNLALNGAQAMAGHGTLRLSVARTGDRALVEVLDSGPGIPAPMRERVFEPFFTTKSRGTGLGLSIVQRVAEQHGGEVSLVCPPAGGTAVRLTLPLPA